MWIFNSAARDLLWLHAPGFAGFLLATTLAGATKEIWLLYAFLAVAVVDAGHVYTTWWRTWWHPAERRSHAIYLWAPLTVFVGAALWLRAGWPHFWTFVVYATLFHHVRQFYGILRWYERLNARECRATRFYFHALTLTPLAVYHFRPDAIGAYYSERDLFLASSPAFYEAGIATWAALVTAWLVHEARLFRSGLRETNRFLGIAAPSTLYGISLFWGASREQILFPLLLAHGVAYFALLALSLWRTRPERYSSMGATVPWILGTAAILGPLDKFLEDGFMNASASGPRAWMSALAAAALVTPLLCHYVFDAFIWRGRHREAHLVYARHRSRAG